MGSDRLTQVLIQLAKGGRWFVTDEVCTVASKALAKLQEADKVYQSQQKELHSNANKIEALQEQFQELVDNFKSAELKYGSDIVAAKEHTNHLRQQKVDLQHEVNKLSDAMLRLNDEKKELETQKDALEYELDEKDKSQEALKKKYADLWAKLEHTNKTEEALKRMHERVTQLEGVQAKAKATEERLEVAERELDEKHKTTVDIADHLVEALHHTEKFLEKARLEAASLRSI